MRCHCHHCDYHDGNGSPVILSNMGTGRYLSYQSFSISFFFKYICNYHLSWMFVRTFLLRKRLRNGKQTRQHSTLLKSISSPRLNTVYMPHLHLHITRRRVSIRSTGYYRRATRCTRFLFRRIFASMLWLMFRIDGDAIGLYVNFILRENGRIIRWRFFIERGMSDCTIICKMIV